MMFCKPPCPEEPELAAVPDASNDQSGPERSRTLRHQDEFGRLIASETAGPERRLPPVVVRTG